MDRREVIRVALRTLARNKLRTALTLLGITIGISAVICTVAIGQGGQAAIQEATSTACAPAPATPRRSSSPT
jgi:putative ABC transport system permease protein